MGEVSKEAVEALKKSVSALALSQGKHVMATDAHMIVDFLHRLGFTITRAEPAPLLDEVENALDHLLSSAVQKSKQTFQHFADAASIRAHISTLESKLTTLRNAAEIGLAYVVAAQSGLTFTKPKMASDVEVINDALKMGGGE